MRLYAETATDTDGSPSSFGGEVTTRPRVILPVLTCVVGLSVSVLVAGILKNHEQGEAWTATERVLERVKGEVTHNIETEVFALEDMARRWERQGGIDRMEWEADVERIVARFGHIQAIEWVDRSFHVRWIVPLEGNEQAQDLDLGFEARRREALEHARDTHSVVATKPIDLVQGGKGFLVFVPLRVAGSFEGFVLGVYRIDPMLKSVVRDQVAAYELEFSAGDEVIFATIPEGGADSAGAKAAAVIRVRNLAWHLEVRQGVEPAKAHLTRMPLLVALGGMLASLLSAFLFHYGRLARWQTACADQSNETLRREAHRRTRAEQDLREARDDLQRVMASIPDHLWSLQFDAEGRLVDCFHSPVIESITGRAPEYFLGGLKPWLGIVHLEDLPEVKLAFSALRTGSRERASIEFRILRADSSQCWVRDNIRATRLPGGDVRLDGVVTDISERKAAEEQEQHLAAELAHSDRINTMGRMASTIAHELTQPLLAMMSFASACRRGVSSGALSPEDILEDLQEIVNQGDRAGGIIRRLKDFVRMRQLELTNLDVNLMVSESINFLASEARNQGVHVELDLEADMPEAQGDAILIQQVVLNLAKNALDAIVECEDSRRTLRVSTRLCPEGQVEVSVHDTGGGADDDVLEHMFDPFYTTKAEGLGMGLSICRSIIETHSGDLRAERNRSQGLSMVFTLPVAESSPTDDD